MAESSDSTPSGYEKPAPASNFEEISYLKRLKKFLFLEEVIFSIGDDSAANGVRFMDSKGQLHFPGDGYLGHWGVSSCPEGSSIVGFRTKVEPKIGYGGDDTSLNKAEFRCRPDPPACQTVAGEPCVFPYKYKGEWYTGCTGAGSGAAWCATEVAEDSVIKTKECKQECRIGWSNKRLFNFRYDKTHILS